MQPHFFFFGLNSRNPCTFYIQKQLALLYSCEVGLELLFFFFLTARLIKSSLI